MRVVFSLVCVLLAVPAVADAEAPGCPDNPFATSCLGGQANGETFEVYGGGPSQAGGGGASTSPVTLPQTYTTYDYAPACTGSTRTDALVTCQGAYTACEAAGPGFLNYWRWEAQVSRRTGQVVTPPGWVQSPGSFCLGPTEAGLPLIPAISGVLAKDFQELVVLKGQALSDPRGQTLVNYDTRFHTDAKAYVLDPVTILGHRVVVTATPSRYDWYFGDGTEQLDGGPGTTEPLVHTYRQPGRVAPYVVVTWTGTFSVDGGAQQPVIGTAVTTGPGAPMVVREARSQLVSGR